MGGHAINAEMVGKCIGSYQRAGRTVDVERARALGEALIGQTFDTATEAAEYVKCRLWDAGLVI